MDSLLIDEKRMLRQRIRELEEELFRHNADQAREIERLDSELRKTQHIRNGFYEIFPEVIFEFDSRGYLTFVNKKAFDIFEYNESDLKNGLSILSFIAPEDKLRAKERVYSFLAGELNEYSQEYQVITKNGRVFPAMILYQPIKYGSRVVGARGVLINITRQKQMEEELRQAKEFAEQIYNVTPSAIFTVDQKRRITSWNKRSEEITGYSGKEVLGKPCIFHQLHSCEGYCRLHHANDSKGVQNHECKIITKNGDTRIISKNSNYLYSSKGKVIGAIESFEDITDQTQTLEQLRKAKEKAEKADNQKSVFLANMSHDLRTPVNGIIGFIELLSDPELPADQRDEFLRIIKQSSSQLLNLIEDIIDISKIEANELKIKNEAFNLNHVLEELHVVFDHQVDLSGKYIALKVHKKLPNNQAEILGDVYRLKQIFVNLLSNALKFTEKGEINFGYEIENKNIRYYVSDTGRGIPSDKIPTLFKRFSQIDPVDERGHNGSGLGLAICHGLVSLQGGKIWVESKPANGTTFFFSLPLKRTYAQNSNNGKNEKAMKVDWKNKKILIVEDDNINYKFLEILLRRTGAHIIRATNGKAAVEICEEQDDINVVLMDIQLPVMDGYEASREIKALRNELYIIAQTANAMADDQEKCFKAGCDDYIAKPISPNELLNKLARIFNMKWQYSS